MTKGGGPHLQDLPQALHRFLELFNAGEYWESHEVLEGPWREGGSDFYQGLILYASAFVHAQRGNAHGVGAQLEKAERKLAGYRPCYLGVAVDAVLAHAARCRQLVENRRDEDPRSWLGVADVPRLELDTRLVRGDEPELRRGEANLADDPHRPRRRPHGHENVVVHEANEVSREPDLGLM